MIRLWATPSGCWEETSVLHTVGSLRYQTSFPLRFQPSPNILQVPTFIKGVIDLSLQAFVQLRAPVAAMSIGSKSNSTPEQVDLEPNRNMQRNRDAWLVVHTGALHVCNRREAFIAFQEIKAFTVSTKSDNPSLGLNHTYTARGIGQTRINITSVDGTSHERVLQDVLHVPEAFANFVSLPRLFCPAEEQYKLDRKLGVAYSMDGRELAWFPPDNQGLLCLVLDNSLEPLFEGPSALHRNAPTVSIPYF